MSKRATWHLSDLAWGKTLGAGKLWDKLWDKGYCQKWDFSLCELRCRLISDSRLTAYVHDKSYHSLLNVFPQKSSFLRNPRATEWGKTAHVPKKGWQHYFICLWVLFHCWCQLHYGSTAATKMSRVESSCWFGWKITLKEKKKQCFQLLPLTCCGHHLWHGGGAGSGSPGCGAEWKRIFWQWLPLTSVKAHWKLFQEPRFLSSCIEMDPEEYMV